tara:strand:- start:335 stop:886 length:552 start_codon:yes stop_codon:yes gene_type:complete
MTAIELVLKWHKNQMRSGELNGCQLPFIVHPISVMRRVWGWGFATPIVMDACACHDTKEDTDITWEELREVIGEDATDIVAELTYVGTTPEEKAEYIKSFKDKSIEALVIKVGDRLENVIDFMLTKPDYAKKYCDKAKLLFQALVDRKEELPFQIWNKITNDIDETINDVEWLEDIRQEIKYV